MILARVPSTAEDAGEVFLPGSWISQDYQYDILKCRQNPNLQSILDSSQTPVLNVTDAISSMIPCSTTNYCGRVFSDTYPKWCYTNSRSMPEGAQRDICAESRWIWCDADVQDSADITWRFVSGATIIGNLGLFSIRFPVRSCATETTIENQTQLLALVIQPIQKLEGAWLSTKNGFGSRDYPLKISQGNEKRFETRYFFDLQAVQWLREALTTDLWLSEGSPTEYVTLQTRRMTGFFLSGTAILKQDRT